MAGDPGTSFVPKLLDDIANVLPKLADNIVEFTTTVASVVDKVVEYFDNEENQRNVAETAHDARTICQELLATMIYCDSYMNNVDTFAQHARHRRRQDMVVEALQQETPQFELMKEYISQLKNSLSEAEDSHTIFEESGFGGILARLDSVLVKSEQNLVAEVKMKKKIIKTGGAVAGGAMAVAGATGAGLAALTALPTAGLASTIILGITAGTVTALGAGIGGVTTLMTCKLAIGHEEVIQGIKALLNLVSIIVGIGKSIQLIILEVRMKMNNASNSINRVDSASESVSSMMFNLEMLFEKLNTVGQTCHDCHQRLNEKKQFLETTINKLLNL